MSNQRIETLESHIELLNSIIRKERIGGDDLAIENLEIAKLKFEQALKRWKEFKGESK